MHLGCGRDPRAIVRDPDPRSRIGALRLIGYSPSARFVLTVIIDPPRLGRDHRVESAGD
jgi:hypothetical protein